MKQRVYLGVSAVVCVCVWAYEMRVVHPMTHLWSGTDIYIYEIWYTHPHERNGLFITRSSSCVIKFVIGLFLGVLLIDMSTFKEPKFFPCPSFSPLGSSSSPTRGLSNEADHPYLLTLLTLKGLPSLNCSEDIFSCSDDLSLQSECIQACSHFVKGALGWEKESSNWCSQNPFKLAQFSVQDKMAKLKYWILMPPYVGRKRINQSACVLTQRHSDSLGWVSVFII